MVRTKQGGSILGFIVVAVTLAALLVGGVWAVRHVDFGASVASDDAEVAQAPADDEASKGDAKSDDQPASDTETPAETADRTAPANEVADTDASGEQSTETTPAQSDTQTESVVTEMPQTGPVGDSFRGVGAGLLIGAIAAYVASRRQVTGL